MFLVGHLHDPKPALKPLPIPGNGGDHGVTIKGGDLLQHRLLVLDFHDVSLLMVLLPLGYCE